MNQRNQAGPLDGELREEMVEEDERFHIQVGARGKLCPFCMSLVPQNTNLLQHARAVCSGYDGAGTDLPSIEKMHQHRERILIRSRLESDPAWKVFDRNRQWYCPYCAGNTGITRSEETADLESLTSEVLDHLRRCHEYSAPDDPTRPTREIKEAAEKTDRENVLKGKIKGRIQREKEEYIQSTPDGKWICPYCAEIMENIQVGTEVLLKESAPSQIASHLAHSCEPFQNDDSMVPVSELKKVSEKYRKEREEADDEHVDQHPAETDQVQQLAQELSALQDEMDENRKIKQGLEDAGQVQKGLMPEEIPELGPFELGTHYRPSSHLGGDFYDIVKLDEQHVGFALGDVAGHGVDSALIMGLTKKSVNIRSEESLSPKEVLSNVNVDILPEVNSSLFVTCIYGVLNIETGTVRFARAGHNYSLLFKSKMEKVAKVDSKGMGLGIVGPDQFDQKVENTSFRLEEGDILFNYTDGLVEGVNDENEEFGIKRVAKCLRSYGVNADAQELVENTVDVFHKFIGEKGQEDDLTVFAIRHSS